MSTFDAHDVTEALLSHPLGYSVNTLGEQPTSGYMVGVKGMGTVLDHFEVSALYAWVCEHWSTVANDGWGELYFGIWTDQQDGGRVYLDVSDRFGFLDSAIYWAEQNGELAVWDVTGAREIRL